MTWLRIDDGMLDHPKWRRAIREGGSDALLVWMRLLSWSSRHLTDGVIPGDVVADVAQVKAGLHRSKALRALEEAGLITRGDPERDPSAPQADLEQITIVDYLQRNPSRSEVQADRERRSQSQRIRRRTAAEAGLHQTSEPPCNGVPARPGPARPIPEREERARAVTMPGPDPTDSYLASCMLAGVKPDQARSTWTHYWAEGLPARGVEKLEPWLVHRAKERTVQLTRATASGTRAAPVIDLDTTGAATAFRATDTHRAFAREHRLELERAVREYRASPAARSLDTLEQERDFMSRLRCWAASGTFIADGPLPKPRRAAAGGKES